MLYVNYYNDIFLNLGIPSRSKLIWASFYYELWFDPFFRVYHNSFVNFHYVCYFNFRSNKSHWDYTIYGFLDLTVWDFHPAEPEGTLWILSLLTLVFVQGPLMLFWKSLRICFYHMYQIYVLGTSLQTCFSIFVHIIKSGGSYREHCF